MDVLFQELTGGLANWDAVVRVVLRLTVAALCGAWLGWERRRTGHPAGIRTHMLVCLAATVFTLVPMNFGAGTNDLSRVIQGIAAGVGFLGAGSIMKEQGSQQVHGLTTAADIWVTAAIGVALGTGQYFLGVLATALTWVILKYMRRVEECAAPSPIVTDEQQPQQQS